MAQSDAMDTNAIRALTFDVFGTVVDWRSGRDFLDLADRLGC